MTTLKDTAMNYKFALDAFTSAEAKMKELLKPLEAARDAWEKELKRQMNAESTEAVSVTMRDGVVFNCSLEPKQAPAVKDWEALYNWIHETRQFSFLHRRLSATPVIEMYQGALDDLDVQYHGEETPEFRATFIASRLPPGVEVSEYKELKAKITAAKKPRRAKI